MTGVTIVIGNGSVIPTRLFVYRDLVAVRLCTFTDTGTTSVIDSLPFLSTCWLADISLQIVPLHFRWAALMASATCLQFGRQLAPLTRYQNLRRPSTFISTLPFGFGHYRRPSFSFDPSPSIYFSSSHRVPAFRVKAQTSQSKGKWTDSRPNIIAKHSNLKGGVALHETPARSSTAIIIH
jgi:hypothetical protein